MKRSAFKPPRPAKANGPTAASASGHGRKKKAIAPASSSSSDEALPLVDSDLLAGAIPADDGNLMRTANKPSEVEPSIPPALVNRLVHHFLNESTQTASKDTTEGEMRVDKTAMPVIHRYIETFVREAVARAALEHQLELEAKRAKGIATGFGDDFLEVRIVQSAAPLMHQVEDLEKLAPQLLLDF